MNLEDYEIVTPEINAANTAESVLSDMVPIAVNSEPLGSEHNRRVGLKMSLDVSKGVDPSTANRITDNVKETGYPRGTVQRNLGRSEEIAKNNNLINNVTELDDNGLVKYPKSLAWIEKPENMAVAKNDHESLLAIEKAMRSELEDDSVLEDIYNALGQGGAQLTESIADIPLLAHQAVAYPFNFAAEKFDIPSLKMEPPKWLIDNPISEYYGELAKNLAPDETEESAVKQIFEQGEIGKGAYNVFLQAVSNTPQLLMLGMGGAAGLAQKVTLGAMGTVEASSSLKNDLKRGKSTVDALPAAILKGTAEGFFEKYTLGMVGDAFKKSGAELVKTIGKESAKRMVFRQSIQLLKNAGIEGSSEAATSIAQDLSDYITGDVEALSGIGERALNAGLVGGFIGTSIGGMGQVREQIVKSKELHFKREQLNQVEKILEEKLKDVPSKQKEEFLESVNPGENIYIEPSVLRQFYQKKGEPVEGEIEATEEEKLKEFNEIIERLGISEQLVESETTGRDLEINAAKWMVEMSGTDAGKVLKEDLRFSVDGVTGNEVTEIKKNAAKTLVEIHEELKDSGEIEDFNERTVAIRDKLILPKRDGGFGMKAEDADANLAVLVTGGRVFAGKQGISLNQWIDKVGLSLEVGGEFTGKIDPTPRPVQKNIDELTPEVQVEANLRVDNMIESMIADLSEARPGSRTGIDNKGEPGRSTIVNKSTFPDWFKDLKIASKSLDGVAKRKKGAPYKRLRAKAIEFLTGGYETQQSGQIFPDNTFREMVGLGKFEDEMSQDDGREFNADEFDDTLFQTRQTDNLGFYSKLGVEVDAMDFKSIPAKNLAARLKKIDGVKKDELDHTGIIEYLDTFEGKITKDEVQAYLKNNGLEITEVVKGEQAQGEKEDQPLLSVEEINETIWDNAHEDIVIKKRDDGTFGIFNEGRDEFMDNVSFEHDGNTTQKALQEAIEKEAESIIENTDYEEFAEGFDAILIGSGQDTETKFSSYTLPGGENYREVLLTVPSVTDGKQDFTSSHFDEKNILAHMRLNDREIDGKKVLFIEEIQSDWHQEGRSKGYASRLNEEYIKPYKEEMAGTTGRAIEDITSQEVVEFYGLRPGNIPDAPFKQTEAWTMLVFKRVLSMAAEQGYDSVSWTPGEVQADRYDLSKQIDSVGALKNSDGTYSVEVYQNGRIVHEKEKMSEPELEDTLGKELTKKIINEEGKKEDSGYVIYEGENLKVGGEGMKSFYDKMLPNAVKKYIKKLDKRAKVGVENLEVSRTELHEPILEFSEEDQQKHKDIAGKLTKLKEKKRAASAEFSKKRVEFKKEEKAEITRKINELMKARNAADIRNDDKGSEALNKKIEIQRTKRTLLTESFGSVLDNSEVGKIQDEMFKLYAERDAIKPIFTKTEDVKTQDVWTLPITEQLKSEVLKGQTLFQDKGDIKGATTFNKGTTLINLFEKADRSTFLHEVGHIFVNEMQEMVKSGDADAQTITDLNTLMEFTGGKLDRAGLEKLAEGFETYLMEGKAPSLELKSAFQKFKSWLTAIYERMQGVAITDDVRGVFDRMLATEQQMNEMNEFYKQRETVAELVDAPALVQEEQIQKEEKAKRTSEELNLSRHLNAYIEALGGKTEIKNKFKKEVDLLPEYVAMDIAISNGAFSADEIKAAIGAEKFKELKKKFPKLIKVKGNTSLAEVVLETEYEGPNEMLDAMVNAKTKAQEAKQRTDELIDKKTLELADAIAGQDTLEDYHNEDRLSFIIAEHQLLAKKAKKEGDATARKIQKEAYRDVARETLANKKSRLASRYDLYAKTEQRYAKKSYDAAKKGDWEKALEFKNKQILNHMMVQEAVKNRDIKRKIEEAYKSKKITQRLKKTENSFAQVAAHLINSYGLNKKISPSIKVIPKLHDIDEMLEAQIPDWVMTGVTPSKETNWKEVKMSELIELHESIGSIVHVGRDALSSMTDLEFKTIEEIVSESVGLMKEVKSRKKFSEQSKIGRIWSKVRGKVDETVMFEYLFEHLDNFNMHRTGKFGILRQLFNKGREAEGNFKDIMADTMGLAAPHLSVLEKAKDRLEDSLGKGFFDLDGIDIPRILKEFGKDQWTAERMVAIVLNMGNDQNMQALKNAYELSDSQLKNIASYFTAKELRAIQGIWDVTDTLFKPLNDANFKIYNRSVPKVKAHEITFESSDGELVNLAGGYYPLQFDSSVSDVAEKNQQEDLMKSRNNAVLRSGKPTDGMTKARVSGHSLPPLLSISVWTRHINDTARYISHSEYLRDMNRITNNEEWKANFRDTVGDKLYKEVRNWLKFQARPERQITGDWEKFLDQQKGLATAAILGLNMSVALKQRLSGLSAQADLGGTWIFKALRDADIKGSILGMEQSELWQEVRSKSAYIRAREGNIDREIHDTVTNLNPFIKKFNIKGIDKNLSLKDMRDATFFLIQANDRAMTGVVWKAAYNKKMHELKNEFETDDAEKKAVTFADAIVAQTQPSALPLDLNAMQKSEGAVRLFTAFMTWTFKQGNRFQHKYAAWQNGAISTKEYSKHVIYEGLMAPWGATIIGSLMLDGELPEWWEYMTSPAEYQISWIPIVREVPSSIKYRDPIGKVPALEPLNRVKDVGVTAYKWLDGDKEFFDLLWSMGRAAETATGIPALKATKNMYNTHLMMTGQKK